MKRPFGFDSAIDVASHDDGFANMSISKELILELDNYICQLEVKCDATQPRKTVSDAWTHGMPPSNTYCSVNHDGDFVNCFLIGRDDMGAFVYRVDGKYYQSMLETNFKPIKPSISKAEAWDKLAAEMENPEGKSVFDEFYKIFELFDVK